MVVAGQLASGKGENPRFWIATPEEARELMARNGLPFRSSKGGDP
jgi:hypothetical protein